MILKSAEASVATLLLGEAFKTWVQRSVCSGIWRGIFPISDHLLGIEWVMGLKIESDWTYVLLTPLVQINSHCFLVCDQPRGDHSGLHGEVEVDIKTWCPTSH